MVYYKCKAEALSIYSKASINNFYSRVVYVVSSHKRRNWMFTHEGLSAHVHNNYCAKRLKFTDGFFLAA